MAQRSIRAAEAGGFVESSKGTTAAATTMAECVVRLGWPGRLAVRLSWAPCRGGVGVECMGRPCVVVSGGLLALGSLRRPSGESALGSVMAAGRWFSRARAAASRSAGSLSRGGGEEGIARSGATRAKLWAVQ